MREIWNSFWYEWVSPPSHMIRYGGGPQGYRRFRKQRFINVVFGTIILILLLIIAL